MAEGWTRFEVEATVADYRAMLKSELRSEAYNKSAHRRSLVQLIKRSDLAIDRKHMNISAILCELGRPWIDGYKPYSNYQGLLREVVVRQVSQDAELNALIEATITAVPTGPDPEDILSTVVAPPDRLPKPQKVEAEARPRSKSKDRDFLAEEERNSALGRAGEEFVLKYERARLLNLGLERLVDRVEHVAVTIGASEGFDVRSFSEDGSDRFIEVKTTTFGSRTPFYVTANELGVSKRTSERYHLYRLFHFRKAPRQFHLKGPLDDVLLLTPTVFRAALSA